MPLVKARPFPFFFFFFNDTATTEIYTLSLHDALPIYPQLVLEMAVLRLATLPPLLPVDDILRRLEALGAGSPASDSAAPSEPGRAAVTAPAGEGLWEQFLARVRDDKVSLYLALATGKLVVADDPSIRIAID